jgi:hypothetical protein
MRITDRAINLSGAVIVMEMKTISLTRMNSPCALVIRTATNCLDDQVPSINEGTCQSPAFKRGKNEIRRITNSTLEARLFDFYVSFNPPD